MAQGCKVMYLTSALAQRALVGIPLKAFLCTSKTSFSRRQQSTSLAIENISLLIGFCALVGHQRCLSPHVGRGGGGEWGRQRQLWEVFRKAQVIHKLSSVADLFPQMLVQ